MEWEWVKFEEVIQKVEKTKKVPKKSFLESGDFPVVSQESELVSGFWNIEADVFKATSPVVIFGDHTKVVKYVDFDFVLGADGVKVLKPIEGLNAKFFAYYLSSIQLKDLGYARHYRLLKEIKVPVPSIKEQKRIVATLDEALADIDKARALTERNLENARELFESYLLELFGKPNKDWKVEKLKALTSKIGSGATPKGGKASYKSEGISLIRSMNVYDRAFKYKDLAFIDESQANKLSNVVVESNDILLNITGASVARCCIVPQDVLPARVNQHVSIIRLGTSELSPCFLNYGLTSRPYKAMLLGIGEAGSTRQAITKRQIEEFEFAFPASFDEQNEIIESIQKLNQQTVWLASKYEKKLLSLEELKKSLLQKAFTGELTRAAS